MILVVALSFHAIFEGIAFGLLNEIHTAWQLAVGIIIHEATASIALGSSLTKSGLTKCQLFAFLSVFTLITPIGIIIGLLISEKSSAIVDMIFMAISAGTFFYVSCTEIIVNEFKSRRNLWWKMFAVLLGGFTIIGLWFIESEHHHHGPVGEEDPLKLICERFMEHGHVH